MLYWSLLECFSVTFIPGGMAESVDAVDLKSADRKVVGVQFSLPPPHYRSVLEIISSNDMPSTDFF
jgi:hypothetical protein